MESVDNNLPVANDAEDVAPSTTSVNWEMTAKALQVELSELRPLVGENRRLKQCIGGVRVFGRALKVSKEEVRRLRRLLEDTDLSPDDTGDYTTSSDQLQVTPDDETVNDKEDDIKYNKEGAIKAEDVMILPKDEDEVVGNSEDEAEGAMEDVKLVGELQKEYLTTLVNQSHLTRPIVGAFVDQEVRNGESEMPKNDSNGDTSKTGFEANTQEDPETNCNIEALITPMPSSSNVLPHQEISANVRPVATITDKRLKHQEFSRLQIQVQELMKVNMEWKKHWRQKKSEFIAELSEKDHIICRIQTQLDDALKEAEMKANHYEQTLLTAKTRIEKIEEENQVLKKDVSKEQQRNEQSETLNRTLIKQNLNMTEEIMRLKQALEKKYQQHVPVNQSPSSETASTYSKQARSSEPKTASRNDDSSSQQPRHIVVKDTQAQLPATAPMPLKAPADEEKHDVCLTVHASQNVEAVSEKKTNPQKNISEVTDISLSKQDMKEQVELLRQQNQMYESDFKKERADRQKARNELQTLRHQLNKQKKQKHTQGQERHYKIKNSKDDIKTKAQGPPKHGVYSPPDQQLEAESTPRRDHTLKTKPICRTDKDIAKHGRKAICKVVSSKAIIIQTDPKGRGFQINLQAESDTVKGRKETTALLDPFICPRCQKLFAESEWESFEHHVTLCNRR